MHYIIQNKHRRYHLEFDTFVHCVQWVAKHLNLNKSWSITVKNKTGKGNKK